MTDDAAGRWPELQPFYAVIAGSGLLEIEVANLPGADHTRSPSRVAPRYDETVACRECGAQQTFRGTTPEICGAAERWNSEHQRGGRR
jgi:hypothetical protein